MYYFSLTEKIPKTFKDFSRQISGTKINTKKLNLITQTMLVD